MDRIDTSSSGLGALRVSYRDVAPVFGLPARTYFLEHLSDVANDAGTPSLIAGHGIGAVYESDDLGATWRTTDVSAILNDRVTRCFTLRNGNRIVRTVPDKATCLVSPDWRLLARQAGSPVSWHGTWSIDESPAGTIMYCEYTVPAAEIVRVWRSRDGGATWDATLEVPGKEEPSEDPTFIRHFHTCQYYPTLGAWIVSSGDYFSYCRVWLSRDDGESWTEAFPKAEGESPERQRRMLRHTAEWCDGKSLYWPTDDRLGLDQAGLVRFDVADMTLHRIGMFSVNEMRSFTKFAPGRHIAISESKQKGHKASIHATDVSGAVELLGEIDAGDVKTGLTYSQCSRHVYQNKFYSYDDGVVSPTCRFIEWSLVRDALEG